jgi:hypothetical protein
MIQIRPYKDSDEGEIIKLFRVCFGKEISIREWLWKYKKSPSGSLSYVVLDCDKLISHYGGIKYLFSWEGETLLSYQSCDVMTHPNYRGKIFSKKPLVAKAGEMFYRDNVMDFAFGFPSERHARLQHLALGCAKHKSVALFKKELSTNHKIRTAAYMLKVGWDTVNSEALDSLWKDCSNASNLSIVKDSKYLFWRYMENPREYYTVVTLKDMVRRKVVSLAVIKCSGFEMNIYDFFVKDDYETVTSFWHLLEAHALKMQANVVNVWINPEENIAKYLVEMGYKAIEDLPLSVRTVNKKRITTSEFYKKYYYRMGDYL